MGKTCHKAARFHVLAINIFNCREEPGPPVLNFTPGLEMFPRSVQLEGDTTFDIGRESAMSVSLFVDTSIAESRECRWRHTAEFEFHARCFCERSPRQTD